jgi:hypothetical protein
MLRTLLAAACLIGLGAEAMPQFEKRYLCTESKTGQTAIVGFDIIDGKLFLSGLGDVQKEGLPCVNQPKQSKSVGAMSVTLGGSCDEKSLSAETGIDMGAGSFMNIAIGILKTSDSAVSISVKVKGNMNGQSLDGDVALNCVK